MPFWGRHSGDDMVGMSFLGRYGRDAILGPSFEESCSGVKGPTVEDGSMAVEPVSSKAPSAGSKCWARETRFSAVSFKFRVPRAEPVVFLRASSFVHLIIIRYNQNAD